MKTSETNSGKVKIANANAATDPGVLFEVGNSFIGFKGSFWAGMISLGVGVMGFFARKSAEKKRLGLSKDFEGANKSSTQKVFNYISNNPGVAMIISGTGLLISSGFVMENTEMPDVNAVKDVFNYAVVEGRKASILMSFGVSNSIRGIARGQYFEEHKTLQKTFDAASSAFAAIGLSLAGSDEELGLNMDTLAKTFYVTGAATDVAQSFNILPNEIKVGNKSIKLSPDRQFAAGCLTTAFLDAGMAVPNILFATAYLSIDAMKSKHKAFAEYTSAGINTVKRKLGFKPADNTPQI